MSHEHVEFSRISYDFNSQVFHISNRDDIIAEFEMVAWREIRLIVGFHLLSFRSGRNVFSGKINYKEMKKENESKILVFSSPG